MRNRLTLLALLLVLLAAAPAGAAVNGFHGDDGDQAGDCSAGVTDWACLAAGDVEVARDGAGAVDDTFSGSKYDDPGQWSLSSSGVPDKSDLRAVWTAVRNGGGRHYLNAAFQRVSGGGDAFLGIEIHQSEATWVNAKGTRVPCRSNGDVLISFEGSGAAQVQVLRWTGTGGPAECPEGGSGSYSSPAAIAAGGVEAAMNASPFSNVLAPLDLGPTFATATFGEAALDLVALADAADLPKPCEYFRRVTAATRSSSSVTSNLQDSVPAIDIVARACRTPAPPGGGGTDPLPQPPAAPTIGHTPPGAVLTVSDLVLSGSAPAGTTVTVYDGAQPVDFVPVVGGSWTLALDDLAEGTHTFTADATDPTTGLTSPLSAADTVRIDTAAPAPPTASATADGTTVTVHGTAEPGSVVTVTENGVVVGTVVADPVTGAYAVVIPDVTPGSHTYQVTASDGAGNASAAAAATVVVEAPGGAPAAGGTPFVPITAPAGAPGGTAPAGGVLGATATACIAKPFNAYVRLPGVKQVTFYVDGKAVKRDRKADAKGRYSARIVPAQFGAGTHKLTAKVVFRRAGRKARTVKLRFRRCDDGCVSRRNFTIRVPRPKGETLASARIFVNGKLTTTVKGARLKARVRLAGLPKGIVEVEIRAVTRSGKVRTTTRRYRTCNA